MRAPGTSACRAFAFAVGLSVGDGLAGVRVLVTRPERQAGGMAAALRALGAEVVAFPATRIEAPSDGGAGLRAAVARLREFDWVVVSSANGVERVLAAADETGTRVEAGRPSWACVGPATASALAGHGIEASVIAERHVAEGLIEALSAVGLAGARVLLPQAAGARAVLREGLQAAGATVEAVEAYRSVADGRGAGEVRGRLDRREIDAVTFTSPSTVERFVEVIGARIGAAAVAVIGPVTAAAARSLGLAPDVVAERHTVAGLIEALVEHFNNPSRTKLQ